MPIKVGFVKVGNIGSAPLIEFLLDERAEREDIDVRVISAGAKLGVEQAIEVTQKILEFKPNLIITVSPNASLPGPTKIRELVKNAGIPLIVVSDSPAKAAVKQIEEMGQGYIIVEADSMIGARREFLDPVEMAIFNAD
ncbi:MAG: F420-dependent methylenetetrahydromethanopterin dehydrogenase, partial [Nitrososphaerales archaeon]